MTSISSIVSVDDPGNGLDRLREACAAMRIDLVPLIVRTARWVHPDAFRALPCWYPEIARGQPIYDAKYTRQITNTKQGSSTAEPKFEANVQAAKAFVAALGLTGKKPQGWTTCHIWGIDDDLFQTPNTIVRDPRFYSCTANMVWLPTPIKGLTDAVPEVKSLLRVCAWHLYGWACEADEVADEASQIRDGHFPDGYPLEWPAPGRAILPPGCMPFTATARQAIAKRKSAIKAALNSADMPLFPRGQVQGVLDYWSITL